MSVYLIDYENVHFAGLEGVEKLRPQDEVIMFYSQNASTIPMELHVKMMECPAKIQFMHIKKTAKNYLDFQLAAISGYLVATTQQTDFIVISMDTGFDSVLDLWNTQEFVGRRVRFSKRSQIAEVSSRPKKKGTKKPAAKKPQEEAADPKLQLSKPSKPSKTFEAERAKEGVKDFADGVKRINSVLLLRAREAFALPEEQPKEQPKEPSKKAAKKRSRKRVSDALIRAIDEVEQSVARVDLDTPKAKEEPKEKEELKTKEEPKAKEEPKTKEEPKAKKEPKTKKEPKAKAKKLTAEEKEVIRTAVKEVGLKPAEYTKLYKIVANSEEKQDYNKELVQVFGQEKSGSIYQATRKAFEDMK